ncbi:MAG: helix-turn-helix domain-containing protein [Spirochaetes bacterium]|nr:MAG: helix-turn-helix domain-containing protein [Spirochaetota bacterium]
MPGMMMNTKEVAEYLGVHEKQVYALIRDRDLPATRITGKWIFPKDLIDRWIAVHAKAGEEGGAKKHRGADTSLLAAGSNDPVLEILLNTVKEASPGMLIFSSSTGSTQGLRLLGAGETDIAWCHLLDPATGTYNIPYLSSHLGDKKFAVVHLFFRELGFISAKDAPRRIERFEDLTGEGMRFINRQEGSGTRVFLDYNLNQRGIDPGRIDGYGRVVYTHLEAGLALLSGEANVCLATVAVSRLLGLPFVPLVKESFDMVLAQETFFARGVQAFIETLNTETFRKRVAPLGDYDFSNSGRIVHTTS